MNDIIEFYSNTKISNFNAHTGTSTLHKQTAFVKDLGNGKYLVSDTCRKYKSGLQLIGSREVLLGHGPSIKCDDVKVGPYSIKQIFNGTYTYHARKGVFRISKKGMPVFEYDTEGPHVLVTGAPATHVYTEGSKKYFGLSGFEKLQGTNLLFSKLSLSNAKGSGTAWLVLQ